MSNEGYSEPIGELNNRDRPRLIDLKWPSRLKRSNSPF